MKTLFNKARLTALFLFIAILMVLATSMLNVSAPGLVSEAIGATTNYAPTTSVYTLPIQISGNQAVTTTPVKFQIPYAAKLIGFSAAARSTSGTITVDFQKGGVSMLSAPISLSSNVVEATIATTAIADESTMTVVITVTSGSANDITVLPTLVR